MWKTTKNTEFCSFGASCPGYKTVHGLKNITGLCGVSILLLDSSFSGSGKLVTINGMEQTFVLQHSGT